MEYDFSVSEVTHAHDYIVGPRMQNTALKARCVAIIDSSDLFVQVKGGNSQVMWDCGVTCSSIIAANRLLQ